MLKIELTNALKRDLKRYKHKNDMLLELQLIIERLANCKRLFSKYKNHRLTGNWASHMECHIKSDILLIYKIDGDTLFLTRLGFHSELF